MQLLYERSEQEYNRYKERIISEIIKKFVDLGLITDKANLLSHIAKLDSFSLDAMRRYVAQQTDVEFLTYMLQNPKKDIVMLCGDAHALNLAVLFTNFFKSYVYIYSDERRIIDHNNIEIIRLHDLKTCGNIVNNMSFNSVTLRKKSKKKKSKKNTHKKSKKYKNHRKTK